MTQNQSTILVNNPNTKKALAVLQKFAAVEATYKAAEKEAKEATELIKQAMIAGGVDRVTINTPELTGYITLAERTNYKTENLDEVDPKFHKAALDTDKIKAEAVLTGALPAGVTESKTQYITKKFKAVE